MDTYKEVMKLCKELNMEWFSNVNKTENVFYCSKKPSANEQKKVKVLLPKDAKIHFEETIKLGTVYSIETVLIMSTGMKPNITLDKSSLRVEVNPQLKVDENTQKVLNNVINNDGYIKSWEIIINGEKHIYNDSISEARVRNINRTPITDDDIVNLEIALNTTKTVEDFLKLIDKKE